MRNVLVTGGAGFIGSHLVDHLLAEGGWHVTVVDDFNDFYSPEIKRANVAEHVKNENYRLAESDIRDRDAMKSLFDEMKFDVVVHLAALAGVRPSLVDPIVYCDVNINGTVVLLDLAREYGTAKFVFGSSSSVYGINAKVPFSEGDPITLPISPYAATKGAGELHLYGMRIVALRFFTAYGARQRPDLAIHKFARLITDGKPVQLFGDGTSRRDYVYIDDIIQGVRAALDYDGPKYDVFNLGESETIELRRLVELLEGELGQKATIEYLPMQPGDVPITFADITKSRNILGYNPTTKIADGMPKFVKWFRSTT
jgi:UDP-glucuronate 4-epimerase